MARSIRVLLFKPKRVVVVVVRCHRVTEYGVLNDYLFDHI